MPENPEENNEIIEERVTGTPATLPDIESFHRAVEEIETFATATLKIARQKSELYESEKILRAQETTVLRKRLAEKDNELEQLRKAHIDFTLEISRRGRAVESLTLKIKQMQEQLNVYKVDVARIEELEAQLRDSQKVINSLRTSIEEMNTAAAQKDRAHRDELNTLALKYEQQNIKLTESIRIAEEKASAAETRAERSNSASQLAQSEKEAALEEINRRNRDQKNRINRLQRDLSLREAVLSEQQRNTEQMQRDYEHKIALTKSHLEQMAASHAEVLRNELEDKKHELACLRYSLEQLKEDHKRTIDQLKQDFEKRMAIRADEIRRQFILKSANIPTASPTQSRMGNEANLKTDGEKE